MGLLFGVERPDRSQEDPSLAELAIPCLAVRNSQRSDAIPSVPQSPPVSPDSSEHDCPPPIFSLVFASISLGAQRQRLVLLSSRVRLCPGDLTGAIRVGIAGTNARPTIALAWVTLADCLAIAGRHGVELRALNPAKLPIPELESFPRALLPNRRQNTSTTAASSPSNSDHRSGDGTLLPSSTGGDDRGFTSGSAGAAAVDDLLAERPAMRMTDGKRAKCAMLVRISDAIGWNSQLVVRSDSFADRCRCHGRRCRRRCKRPAMG